MRSELEQLEQIDQYLEGKMTPDQVKSFEAQMDADPALKSMVKDQQLLIQSVSRKVMMTEINTIAGLTAGAAAGGGATAAGWGMTQWVIAAVTAVGATVGGVAIYNSVNGDQEDNIVEEEVVPTNENNILYTEENTFDTSEYFAFIPTIEKESMEEEEEDETYEEDVKKVYRIEDDRTIDRKMDPLNGFGGISHPKEDKEVKEDQSDNNEVSYTSRIVKNRKATFPGGHLALQNWFEKNLMYPGTAKKDKVQATVRVRFQVKETGEVDILDSECIQLLDENGQLIEGWGRVKYRKSIKYFRRQAERAFRICPEWLPATNTHGSAISSEQVWFVKYNLKGKTEVYSFGDETGDLHEAHSKEGIHDYTDDKIFFEVKTAEDDFIAPTNK